MPECDVLIIGGDIAPDRPGNYRAQDRAEWQIHWLDTEFRQWLHDQSATEIIGIAGNHDFGFELTKDADSDQLRDLPWTYLLDSGTEIDGVKFWGTPWVPNLLSWAFYGDAVKLEQTYGSIPKDTDIVISHGPPETLLDFTNHKGGGHVGAPQALDMLDRVRPKALICGHIHEGFGKTRFLDTDVYNVAYVDEHYVPSHTTVVIDGF
jgi:Icc-related predicted phosphoesterase